MKPTELLGSVRKQSETHGIASRMKNQAKERDNSIILEELRKGKRKKNSPRKC